MANKNLFQSTRGKKLPQTNATNLAGGRAYAFTPQHALAQYVATGCLNGTFYATAGEQLEKIIELAGQVDDHFLAKTAIYSRRKAYMKDTPALLCALLANRDVALLAEVFPQVIDNGKMLRNFVQIVRSGITGRKSLGSAPKRMVQAWLNRANDEALLAAAIGQSPSLADVIKMVHPRPKNAQREAFYAYLIGRAYSEENLPSVIRQFENWKLTREGNPPKVPFQMLTSLELRKRDWLSIAKNAPWQMTRMNLNTFARHGVFKMIGMSGKIANRLKNPRLIRQSRAFPYQLMAAYLNAGDDVPNKIKNALQDAMEIALENVPEIKGNVVVCTDVSGSMHGPVTGYRKGSTSKIRCLDVAALTTAAILRKNPNAIVLPFENDVVKVNLNPRDSVMTNATKLASLPCGGTNCSAPLAWLNKYRRPVDMVIFVSDNESWIDSPHYGYFGGGATNTMREWNQIKQRNSKARMVCIDITPNETTQAKERADILNIGGFSDQVFKTIAAFASKSLHPDHWIGEINQTIIKTPMKKQAI
ncbi:TROVE domain-containing protein [Verrucomicrobiaceae bacterium R5-34]|nr:TROVE domain-containing protein [Verrucomicrobiaceae bacterium R5-34]